MTNPIKLRSREINCPKYQGPHFVQTSSTRGIDFEVMGGKTCWTQKIECKNEQGIRWTPYQPESRRSLVREEEDQQPAPIQLKSKVWKMKNGGKHAAKVIWCHDVVLHRLICLVSRTSCLFCQTREWALCFKRVLSLGWLQILVLFILQRSLQILCTKWLGQLSRGTTSRALAKIQCPCGWVSQNFRHDCRGSQIFCRSCLSFLGRIL